MHADFFALSVAQTLCAAARVKPATWSRYNGDDAESVALTVGDSPS